MNHKIYHYDQFFLFYMRNKLDDYPECLVWILILGGWMRSIGKFSDEIHFPSGFQSAEAFTADECHMLEVYGHTMKGLQEGTLMPVSAEEHLFLAELDGEFGVTSDFAKCWQKYLKKVARCDRQTGKVKKSKRSSAVAVSSNYFGDDEELVLDIDDDQDLD